jgi:hypothetical protein
MQRQKMLKSKDFNEATLQKLEDQKRKLVAEKEELQRKLVQSRKAEESLITKNRNLNKELQKVQFAQQKQALAAVKKEQKLTEQIDLLQRINQIVRKSTSASAPQTPRKNPRAPLPLTPLRPSVPATPVRPATSNSNFVTPLKTPQTTLSKSVQDPFECTLETIEKENGIENEKHLGEADRLFLEAFFKRVVFCRENRVFSSCLPDAIKYPLAKVNSNWVLLFLLSQYFPRVLRLLPSTK